jgi:hypothetical protein
MHRFNVKMGGGIGAAAAEKQGDRQDDKKQGNEGDGTVTSHGKASLVFCFYGITAEGKSQGKKRQIACGRRAAGDGF